MEVYRKHALTFEEQLDLMIGRGMIIDDPDHSIDVLSRISYYRLSAYTYVFRERDGDRFIAGTTFNQAFRLYEFDRQLRLLVMDALERTEIAVRTDVTYRLGHAHGPFGHCEPDAFRSAFDHEAWLRRAEQEAARSTDAFIDHYRHKYAGFPSLPIWMATEVLSLGSLSRLYKGMIQADQRTVSERFDVTPTVMVSWLHSLTYVRNLCAHHSRLWNRQLSVAPTLPRHDPSWQPPVTPTNRRVFVVLLILRRLMSRHHDGEHWRQRIEALLSPIAAKARWREMMGMPTDWLDHPLWNLEQERAPRRTQW